MATASAIDSESDVDRRTKSPSFRGDSASLFRNLCEKKFVSKECVLRLDFPAVRNSWDVTFNSVAYSWQLHALVANTEASFDRLPPPPNEPTETQVDSGRQQRGVSAEPTGRLKGHVWLTASRLHLGQLSRRVTSAERPVELFSGRCSS